MCSPLLLPQSCSDKWVVGIMGGIKVKLFKLGSDLVHNNLNVHQTDENITPQHCKLRYIKSNCYICAFC